MAWYDQIVDEGQNAAVTIASDWLKGVVKSNTKTQTSPQPVATLPADVLAAQAVQSKWLLYGAIGVAILGVLFLFTPKKGKK